MKPVPQLQYDRALLVLRGAALFLAVTFGRQKIGWLVAALHSGQPLSAWQFVGFLDSMGIPFPRLLAVFAVLNESVISLLVSLGCMTRLLSVCLVAHMTIAFFVSIRLGEEPLRAALYLVIFAALAIAGPGRYSLAYLFHRPHLVGTAAAAS